MRELYHTAQSSAPGAPSAGGAPAGPGAHGPRRAAPALPALLRGHEAPEALDLAALRRHGRHQAGPCTHTLVVIACRQISQWLCGGAVGCSRRSSPRLRADLPAAASGALAFARLSSGLGRVDRAGVHAACGQCATGCQSKTVRPRPAVESAAPAPVPPGRSR